MNIKERLMNKMAVMLLFGLLLVAWSSACKAGVPGPGSPASQAIETYVPAAQPVISPDPAGNEQAIASSLPAVTAAPEPAVSTAPAPDTATVIPPVSTAALPAPVTAAAVTQNPDPPQAFAVVTVNSDGYSPVLVHVTVGAEVTWSKSAHCDTDTTIVSDTKGFVGDIVTSDDPYVFYFGTAGTYFYHMDGNDGFKGLVIVG